MEAEQFPIRFDTLDELQSPETLARWAGPVARLEREPLSGLGFSGATLERLKIVTAGGVPRSFVLKVVSPERDWIARDSGDRVGREGLLLDEDRLHGVWEIFDTACLAYSREPERIGLLMNDVSAHIVPNVREPVTDRQEGTLIESLARLHARFWNSEVLELPWLSRPAPLVGLLAPASMESETSRSREGPFFDRVRSGWRRVRERVSNDVARLLWRPVDAAIEPWTGLPRTLIHGDCKVANFAFIGSGRVTAFDWSMIGAAPAGLELGWYLAVNASRLTGTKEQLADRYRRSLEEALGATIAEDAWSAHVDMAVTTGAMMLLWSKALALDEGTLRAQAEWDWWLSRLEPLAARIGA